MKKLLHERLREAIEEAKCDEYYDGFCNYKNEKGYMRYLGEEFACELADEIEKYYIPRPRFEDGEPIQVGDAFVQKIFDEETILGQIGIALYGQLGNMVWFPEEIVPRPEHRVKVFDSDGVEIKVGDTIWLLDGSKGFVVEINCGLQTVKVFDYITKEPIDNPWASADGLTHKEPDSLEKIRDEISKASASYMTTAILRNWRDRITAIMERDE